MKIGVLSDVHGNYPALETVGDDLARWRPDVTVLFGKTGFIVYNLSRLFPRA